MKKIISKLALVSVAMAGLFTSCQIEDLRTTFDLAPALCTVNVQCFYALTGEDITSQCVIESPYAQGATFTIPVTNKAVLAQTIDVKATFTKSGEAQTKAVAIAPLNPGGIANNTVQFFFGNEEDLEYGIRFVEGSDESRDLTVDLEATHYPSVQHDAAIWNLNETEFILAGTAKVEMWKGGKVTAYNPTDNTIVKAYADGLNSSNPITVDVIDFDFNVSAWAMYKVWATRTTIIEQYEVFKKNIVMGTEEIIGTIDYQYYSSSSAQYIEKACPGHEGHYVHGHGTADTHGVTSNAGGGIVYGE